jgi:hypothetical protein
MPGIDDVSLRRYTTYLLNNVHLVGGDTTLEVARWEELVQCMRLMFCSGSAIEEQCHNNLILFGTQNEYSERSKIYGVLLFRLKNMLDKYESMGQIEDHYEKKNLLDQITNAVVYGREATIYLYRQNAANQPPGDHTFEPTRCDVFFQPIITEDLKSHQKLIRYYLEVCRRKNYRKLENSDQVYAPKFVGEDNDVFAHYFEPLMPIMKMMYHEIYPYHLHNAQLYKWLTDSASTTRQVHDYLVNCQEDDFPTLVKNRTIFSFQNGIYDASNNTFYPYETDENWPHRIQEYAAAYPYSNACNYIDSYFDYNKYANDATDGDPLEIETVNCQKIMDCQKFEPDVCRWLYASLGRLIFEVGTKDNWQYVPYFKGLAGTGKSSLLNLVSKFFDVNDVGVLMSEAQTTFSVEHIYDKYMFLGMDVNNKMNFSQTRFNSMVSGEKISVERKFKIAMSVKWSATGAFAGNTYPPWLDSGGSLSRRLMIFLFTEDPVDKDPNLEKKCLSELPAFLKKCVSCYFYYLEKFQNQGIWDTGVLPLYFHRTKQDAITHTNVLGGFVSSEYCILGSSECCTFSELEDTYEQYLIDYKIKKPTQTLLDLLKGIAKAYGIGVIDRKSTVTGIGCRKG